MASSNFPKESVAYVNGNVLTINAAQPRAEAFIVSPDGIFVQVGSTEDIRKTAQKEHLIVHDLHGQFIMPGIHDAHVHMLLSALALTGHAKLPDEGLNCQNVVEELQKGSCVCKYANVNEDWLLASNYSIDDFHYSSLDKDYPDTPVVIRGGAGHSAFLNSEAMKRSGYSLDEQDGQGTCYMRDKDGKLTGEMAENSLSKVMTTIPQPNVSHAKRVLKEAQKMLHRAGVTSLQEASSNTLLLKALREMDASNDLKLNIHPHIVYAPDWIGEEPLSSLQTLLDTAEEYRTLHINPRFVKIILDGVPLPPYYSHAALTSTGEVEQSKLFITNLRSALETYDARGMTVKIHCTGQGATRLTLDTIAAIRTENPKGPKHEIAHCSGVHEADYSRFKDLNVTAEMSPAFFFKHPVTAASEGLMNWDFPTMLSNKAHVTIGSDWGAGAHPDLLPCMHGIVDEVGGGEALCRLLTLSGAEAVGREKEVGSIDVGKKANFVEVDRDLGKGGFEGAKVVRTWFEGEVVWEREGV